MSNINIGIPSLTVNVKRPDAYSVNMQTSTVGVLNAGSYPLIAVSAQSASYALVAQSVAGGASIVYSNVSASNDGYIGHNLFVSNSLFATSITGSLSGSFIGTVSNITGGTTSYIPLWSSNNTLASSILFQTQSGILINSTTQHTPEAPDVLGLYAGNTTSYNLVSGHGTIDNYFQLNIKNFSSGVSASSDIVATADIGTETSSFIDMGINGSGYINNGNGIGNALDGYLYLQSGGDLLIGNSTTDKKIIIFTGTGPATSNARVYMDPLGTVGINTSDINTNQPEALRVRALSNTYNLISAESNINSYAQINVSNKAAGTTASTDFVATNDTGNENTNYIDMGINSSGYTGGYVGAANDAYVYSAGNNLYVGTVNSANVVLFAGGHTDSDIKIVISPTTNHQVTGSVNVSGGINTTAASTITGSLNVLGSISGSLILPANIVSSSTQASTWTVATSSISTTSSFAVTASYANNATLPSGLISSSTQFKSLTSPFTGSFTGSYTGAFTGAYTGSFSGSYVPSYTGTYSGTYSGSPFTGTYSGSYTGQTVLATKDTVSTISLWIRTA